MARRKELGALANKSLNISCFTGKIKCGNCGCSFMHNMRKNKAKSTSTYGEKYITWGYIKGRDDWEFVDIYTDEGITATNTKKRAGFNQMIEDALEGKIQLIVTKSVSRFARNTVDSLTTIRKLKENGIEVFFEKENIWTLDAKGELLLTIMSSLAQEEARNISENTTWGQRKRFADGRYSVNYRYFLGYDRKPGPDGGLVVNEEQAAIVRDIYAAWLTSGTKQNTE